MPHRSESEREMLPTQVSERLLARAAELDAALNGGTELAKLRAAALEAGISSSAFDTALEELRGAGQAPAAQSPRRRPRVATFVLGVCTLLLAGTMVSRTVIRVPVGATVEEAFLLRCLPPGEAAELVRPTRELASNVTILLPAHAPRVLRIRATPEQLAEMRALLEREDGAACAGPATTR